MGDYLPKKKITSKFSEKKWIETAKARGLKSTETGLLDKSEMPFWFSLTPGILELISAIERNRGLLTSLQLPKTFEQRFKNLATQKEAYYSSHIEGAVTSLEAALFQLKSSRKKNFEDESMQMIFNNKEALEYLQSQKNRKFTNTMICGLQQILVRNTHKDKPITVGEYRKGPIYVMDGTGKIVYEGPSSLKAKDMMLDYILWLNDENILHPLVKSALVHLYFVHVHPFDDGNGRSARALSNLYLLKSGYHFINFMAPSDYFDHTRSAYYKAIQNSEIHDGDATYFVIYYLEALAKQLSQVQKEIEKELKVSDIKYLLTEETQAQLDKKQIKALSWMLKNTAEKITTKRYCKINKCSDETARKDFNQLARLNLIKKIGTGRATGYILKAR